MNNKLRPKQPRSHNRVAAVMAHTTKYAFKGRARLASDAGISRSALTRLMSGKTRPSHVLVGRVANALEKALSQKLDCRELLSEDGNYPTPFVCELVGCPGCMPAGFYSVKDKTRFAYSEAKPGHWTGDNQECIAEEWQKIGEIK